MFSLFIQAKGVQTVIHRHARARGESLCRWLLCVVMCGCQPAACLAIARQHKHSCAFTP